MTSIDKVNKSNGIENDKGFQDYKNKMTNYYKELKEKDPSLGITDEMVNEEIKNSFICESSKELGKKYAVQFAEINDIDDEFCKLWKSLLSNIPVVGPIFGTIFSLMNRNNLENLMKDMLRKVEEMIKKSLTDFVKRECELLFATIRRIGEEHYKLTTLWYESKGISSLDYKGNEIKFTNSSNLSSSELEGAILASYLDFKNECIRGLVYFSEKTYIGHTISFYIYTSVMYSTLLLDTIKYGKQMNFPKEIIDGTASIPSLTREHASFVLEASTNMVGGYIEFSKMYYDYEGEQPKWAHPPGGEAGLNLYFSNKEEFPNGASTLMNNNGSFELPNRKGEYYLSPSFETEGYWKWAYPSFRYGTFSLKPVLAKSNPLVLLITNKNRFNRKIKIEIFHCIVGEAQWTLEIYNNTPGEANSITKELSKFVIERQVDPIGYQQGSKNGFNSFGSFSTNHQYIKLTCKRKATLPTRGYLLQSYIYNIRIVDE